MKNSLSTIAAFFAVALLSLAPGIARATCSNLSVPAANMAGYPLLYVYGPTLGPGGTPGASPAAGNSDCTIGGSGGGGGGGAVTAATGSYSDGSLVTLGTESDSAYTGSGNATDTSILKGIYASVAAPPTTPISAATLPLPTNAATSALQTTGNTSLATIASNTPTLNGDGGAPAHITNFPTTQAISAATLPLPTGAASASNQTNGTAMTGITANPITSVWSGSSIVTGGTFQSALAASGSRKGCQIQNTSSAIEEVSTAASPTLTTANFIQPYQTWSCNYEPGQVDQAAVMIEGATAAQAYVVTSW